VKFYVSALVGVIIKVILQNARCNNKVQLLLFNFQQLITHPEDDLGIETCWSDFKCFNVKFYVSTLVDVIIKVILQNARCNNKVQLLLFNFQQLIKPPH